MSKVAIVTGAARGIGRAIAAKFLVQGHRVALLDIDGTALAQTAQGMPGTLALECDVADPAPVKVAVDGGFDAIGIGLPGLRG